MATAFLVRGFWGSTSTKSPLESVRNGSVTKSGSPGDHQQPSLTITKAENVTQEEVFYDPPTTPLLQPRVDYPEPRPSSPSRNGIKNSGLRIDTSARVHSDWKVCPPPRELLEVGFETAPEIQHIMLSSVERVQERVAQEHAQEQAKSNKGKEPMVMEPIVVIEGPAQSGDEAAQVTLATSQSRMSNLSVATASSGDSGYVSGLVASGTPKRRLRAFDRLVGWASGNKETFSISAIVKPSSGHAHSMSVPLSTRSNSPHPPSPAGSAAASTRECVSCLDDFSPKEVVTLTCHSYCKPCFTTLISTALGSETYWPPRCCLTEIPVEVLLPQMDRHTRSTYKKLAEERSVPAGERMYCHSCSAWVPPKNINMAIACAACQSCRKKTCTSCRAAYHSNGECPADPNMRATLQLAEELGWRRCHSCKAMVEHNTGCLHMTCKCKAQFCYVCGVKWRTCNCTDVALTAILTTAQNRRLEVEARQRQELQSRRRATTTAGTAVSNISAADAADLPDILARIEEFETNEAVRKANEIEKYRLEMEARRQKRQEELIMFISKKYHDLRNELEFVHSAQKLAITVRFNDELSRLRNETRILRESHMKESNDLKGSSRARIATLETGIHFDFEEKKAREREIEQDYLAQLQEFWSGHPEKDMEIEQAMEVLTVSHREAQLRWKSKEKAKAKDVMETERANADEMRRRHCREVTLISQDECRIEAERLGAEGWLSSIVEERKGMLGKLEDGDYAAIFHEVEFETDDDTQADGGFQLKQIPSGSSWASSVEQSTVTSSSASAASSGSRAKLGSASASVTAWTELASMMPKPRPISGMSLGPLAEEPGAGWRTGFRGDGDI